MNPQEKNKTLEALCHDSNQGHEAFAAFYAKGRRMDAYANGEMSLISKTIKNVLLDGSSNEKSQAFRLSRAIMRGVYAAIDEGLDPNFALPDEHKKEECFECEMFRFCMDKKAVALRKAYNIGNHSRKNVVTRIDIN